MDDAPLRRKKTFWIGVEMFHESGVRHSAATIDLDQLIQQGREETVARLCLELKQDLRGYNPAIRTARKGTPA